MDRNIKIFSGTSGCKVAEKIAEELGISLGKSKILKFKDGEYYAKIDETVRGADVFVVQSTSMPVNDNLMGLLIFVDALRRASANSINLVIPYYGYARQDRKAFPREPITAKLVSNLLTTAGATRIMTLDLHTAQIQGFFDIPLDNLEALPMIANKLIDDGISGEDTVVVAPNTGMVKKSRKLAEWLDSSIAIVDRRYDNDGKPESIDVIGNIEGKKVILLDDMIATGETLVSAAHLMKEEGATEVYAAATHGIIVEEAQKSLDDSPIKRVYMTDSIRMTEDRSSEKFEILSIAHLFAETIDRITTNKSILSLFEK